MRRTRTTGIRSCVEREPKSIGIILISTDRGLAGGLNANRLQADAAAAARVAGQGRRR